MRKTILFVFILFLSCNKNEIQKHNADFQYTEQIQEIEKESEKDKDESEKFPLVNVPTKKFENISSYGNDGGSFKFDFTLENLTGNKITSVEMKYFVETIFEDNTVLYSPIDFEPRNEYRDNEIFDHLNVLQTTTNDIWLPNEKKDFEIITFGYWGPGWSKRNFHKKIFERTPKSINLICRFKAISIDGEYSFINKLDILEEWKNYQREIGLR